MGTRMSSFSRDFMHVEPCETGATARVCERVSKRFAQSGAPAFMLSDSTLSVYLQSFNSGLIKGPRCHLKSISINTKIYRHVGAHSMYSLKESAI